MDAIGRGGMGEVYRATDVVLCREVAVKVMLPIPETLAAKERFLREARATARLRHPHVVAAYDFGQYGSAYYLAMELVRGRTVGEELRRLGPLPAERAGQLVRQAAAGLAAAHAEGIVHRDIKPDNLLLTNDGCVKVADFGIVRLLDDPTTTLTSAGQIVGTSHFLSPERVLGRPAEPASDVYALGCVLYQLVTGRPPFVSESPASVMFQHVQREPAPPTELRPELPSDLEALTLWMLTKDPARRPTALKIANGVRRPIVMMSETDMATTTVLAVRRKSLRPAFIAITAIAALAVPATVGILSGATDAKPPDTYDLNPEAEHTLPPVAPSTSQTPTPAAVRTVTQTSTSEPSKVHRVQPTEPKASSPPQQKHVGPGRSATHQTHGPLKPKKTKP
ncbi:protein kinase [Kribbella sp. NBC_00709]|uniref:serine/threonine-protein kinase n=1 Tax=Kribbella sp. NBC_00709 TaxID=2975972 RepID=UPI002E282DA7|nr:protein kinase [Kribbella sp. NBC_00709]